MNVYNVPAPTYWYVLVSLAVRVRARILPHVPLRSKGGCRPWREMMVLVLQKNVLPTICGSLQQAQFVFSMERKYEQDRQRHLIQQHSLCY